MKQKKRIISILLVLLFIIVSNKGVFADESTDSLYLQISSNDSSSNTIVVDVCIKTTGANGIKGTLIYDEELELKKVQQTNNLNGFTFSYVPNIETEGERKYKQKNGKGFSFTAVASSEDTNFTGDKAIVKLTFDISKCEAGKEYHIVWDTEDISEILANTYLKYQGNRKSINTSGLTLQISENSNKPKDEDEQGENQGEEQGENQGQQQGENQEQEQTGNKAEEQGDNQGQEQAGNKGEEQGENQGQDQSGSKGQEQAGSTKNDEDTAKNQTTVPPTNNAGAENKANNVVDKNEQANNVNKAANASNNANIISKVSVENKSINNATNTSGANKEKIPQTGNANSILIVGAIIVIGLFALCSYEKIKKLKFTK